MKVFLVAGARPNFMKIAPIYHEMKLVPEQYEPLVVHTGQHYDENMSRVFFEDLELPKPDLYLGVGSGTHGEQTAEIMKCFEPALEKYKPHLVVVVGDVNSTIACALTTAKTPLPSTQLSRFWDCYETFLSKRSSANGVVQRSNDHRVPLLAHVEAGERSFDWSMPEEINRVTTDVLSQLLFTTSQDADDHLLAEGLDAR
ncbi:UDP-N-acetylglucosamine 2-epimerase, partial [bacterium]|nr:UDP-N-acetylglucosamine 2-epimerase [bacterium]